MITFIKSSIILLFFCLLTFSIKAQDGAMVPINVSSPSPTSTGLGKYGQIPVNLFNGLPQISVPVYNVKSQKLSTPISLSYHASGLQVQERASWVGLNWSLNAGGVITRVVKGLPDEKPTAGYFAKRPLMLAYATEANTATFNSNFDKYQNSEIDLDPDVFYFNFDGRTGRLVFIENTTYNSAEPYGKIVISPAEDFQTSYSTDAQGKITKFSIITENGTAYIFGNEPNISQSLQTSCEWVSTNNCGDGDIINPDLAASIPNRNLTDCIQAWYLTDIISPDKLDNIKFQYTQDVIKFASNLYQVYAVGKINPAVGNGSGQCPPVGPMDYSALYTIKSPKLDKIIFSQGEVRFIKSTLSSERLDVDGDSRLKTIEIYPKNSASYVKKIELYYSYFSGNTPQAGTYFSPDLACFSYTPTSDQTIKRLKLDSIQEFGKNNAKVPAYRFYYHNENKLPAITSNAQDVFGFYNGKLAATSLIPDFATPQDNGYTYWVHEDRRPSADIEILKTAMLKRIKFPTGGTTDFEYEPNYYKSGSYSVQGPGIRLLRTYNSDEVNISQIKRYKYEETTGVSSGNLFVTSPLYLENIMKYYNYNGACMECSYHYITAYNKVPMSGSQGNNVGYGRVEEFYDGHLNATSLNGKNGKTVYTFQTQAGYTLSPTGGLVSPLGNGSPLTVSLYEKKSDGTYSIKKTTVNNYTNVTGAFQYKSLDIKKLYSNVTPYYCVNGQQEQTQRKYEIDLNDITEGNWRRVTSQTDTEYDALGNTISTNVSYTYASPSRLSKTVEPKGDGVNSIVTSLFYPHDFATGIYPSMKSKNMINYVVEKRVSQEAGAVKNLLGASKTEYKTFNGNSDQIYPFVQMNVEIEQPVPLTPMPAYIVKDTIESFDAKGNLLQQRHIGDIPNSFVYDIYSVPVGQAVNAAANQIAYSSFEDTDPQWPEVVNAHSIQYSHYHTGKASRRILKGNPTYGPTKDLLITKYQKGKYIFSCWIMTDFVSGFTNGGIDLVAYSLPTPIFSHVYFSGNVSGWRLVQTELDLSGINDSYFPLTLRAYPYNSDPNHDFIVDDMKIYPKDALMTTSTHSLLVGKTSVTDVNNRTVYYEYDNMGRPTLIKDDSKNIIKRFTYNIKQ